MKTPAPITDPELRQRIEWHIEAMRAQLDGTAGCEEMEMAPYSTYGYKQSDKPPVRSQDGEFFPSSYWLRLKPKPKLRPFTPEEARQLVGAVVVGIMGRRAVLLEVDDGAFVLQNHDRIILDEYSTEPWKWKWPHEDDKELRPFGKKEV